jgi:hypothetical protein
MVRCGIGLGFCAGFLAELHETSPGGLRSAKAGPAEPWATADILTDTLRATDARLTVARGR